MKIRSSTIFIGLPILFLFVLLHASAQAQEQAIPAGKLDTARTAATVRKENVDGIQVMRLWELESKELWPQIAVLRVSNASYLKFSQDPQGFMKFVNEHKIFSKDVIIAGPWVSLSSVEAKAGPSDWVLTLIHGKKSTMIVAALPQLMQQ